jgi:hypothetical protein
LEQTREQSVEQIEEPTVDQTVEHRTVAAECGAGVEWSVEAAKCGAGRRNRGVEQVDEADCGAGGLSKLWNRWTEQTVE